MTGLDVLRACERYAGDMQRLTLQYQIAMDAATRVTPRLDGNSGGRSSDVRSAPERFAVKAEGLTKRMDARRAMYAMELEEAANLLERLVAEIRGGARPRLIDIDKFFKSLDDAEAISNQKPGLNRLNNFG